MIEPLEGLPAGVIGFRAVGTIEASDYRDVLDPAIDAAVAEHERIDLVFVMGDEFDHYANHYPQKDTSQSPYGTVLNSACCYQWQSDQRAGKDRHRDGA